MNHKLLAILLLTVPGVSLRAEKLEGIIHLHSKDFSPNGLFPLKTLVEQAKDAGIDVFFASDVAIARWEYGIWPLRGILRKVVEMPSILTNGPEKYLTELLSLQKLHPEIILIPGAEGAPSYFWTGSPFKKDLTINNWHRHFLIVGLWHPKDFYQLPFASNPYRSSSVIDSHWLAVSLVLTILAMIFFSLSPKTSLLILGICTIGIWNSLTAPAADREPYADRGVAPYQEFIDTVTKAGGLVFWNHPEAPNWENFTPKGPVSVQTKPYPEALLQTHDYTGCAVLWEGYKVVGRIGGIWDTVLMEYVDGRRRQPVWAIGELDYHGDQTTDLDIDGVTIVFDAKARTQEAVLQAMKEGHFHTKGKSRAGGIELVTFSVNTRSGEAHQGQTVNGLFPEIKLALRHKGPTAKPIRITLVRNGTQVAIGEGTTPFAWSFEDKEMPLKKSYYRAVIQETKDIGLIITNPIFVTPGAAT